MNIIFINKLLRYEHVNILGVFHVYLSFVYFNIRSTANSFVGLSIRFYQLSFNLIFNVFRILLQTYLHSTYRYIQFNFTARIERTRTRFGKQLNYRNVSVPLKKIIQKVKRIVQLSCVYFLNSVGRNCVLLAKKRILFSNFLEV